MIHELVVEFYIKINYNKINVLIGG